MKNTAALARKWTEFLASRPEFIAGASLLAQFNSGEITSLCECGCNGYGFKLRNGSSVSPLGSKSEKGNLAFQMAFYTAQTDITVEFLLFIDAAGNLNGLDVDCCGNNLPMPEAPQLVEPPFHVHGELASQQSGKVT